MEKSKKPEHPDIEKYGYFLYYSKARNRWYASHAADKGDVYFKWEDGEFLQVDRHTLPNDI